MFYWTPIIKICMKIINKCLILLKNINQMSKIYAKSSPQRRKHFNYMNKCKDRPLITNSSSHAYTAQKSSFHFTFWNSIITSFIQSKTLMKTSIELLFLDKRRLNSNLWDKPNKKNLRKKDRSRYCKFKKNLSHSSWIFLCPWIRS